MTPPPGKSLVYFHRPRTALKYYYSSAWDGTNFITDLGNGHSTAYVCDPGKHIFTTRISVQVAVIEANLLPDKTYDFAPSPEYLSLRPVESKERALIPTWMTNAVWVTRGPGADNYEQTRQEVNNQLIRDFTTGSKKSRLLHLKTEDHR